MVNSFLKRDESSCRQPVSSQRFLPDNDDMRSLHNLIHWERPSILAHTSEFFGTMGSSKIEQRC